MKRHILVKEFWDRSKDLDINNKKYKHYVERFFKEKLEQDVGKGDVTTDSLISKNKNVKASVIARESGIIAGIEEVSLLINEFKVKKYKNDGNLVKSNEIILEFNGNAKKILNYERTLLNILQRMSGIATMTYNIRKLINNNCFIAGTRKTLFPLIDKKAVYIGQGLTHRLNLNDFIIIKDNHLGILNNNIEKAVILANKNKKTKYIEIEVKNEKEALETAKIIKKLKSKKLFAIMFDNMTPAMIKNSIMKIKNNNLLFEASGNINEKNIKEYSKTGVDIVSLGFLTHSAKAFDMSLEIK